MLSNRELFLIKEGLLNQRDNLLNKLIKKYPNKILDDICEMEEYKEIFNFSKDIEKIF